MRLTGLLFLICISCTLSVIGQRRGSVSGGLRDTAARTPVPDATVTILNGKDSSLVTFSRSVSTGRFRIGGLDKGDYRLLISHIGYRAVSRHFRIVEGVGEVDLGEIALTHASNMLDEVTVEGEAPPVTIRHDTIEFSAGAFKVRPDAVVEDLLKRLPGVQVDKNGNIKVNGEDVKKILVDGKEFFGNDPKIATKNLPAEVVDKVQVFDKKSDQAQFTGFDDGNSQKTINLTIKKDKKHGWFGNLTAGLGKDTKGNGNTGAESRYEARGNFNQFTGSRQLSVLGMANNTNQQGFSFQDVLGFSGGMGSPGSTGPPAMKMDIFNSGIPIQGLGMNNQAITTLAAGGLNFNDSLGRRADVHGNYFYNGADDRSDQTSRRQYLTPGNSYIQNQQSSSDQFNANHRLTLISDRQVDSFNSFKLNSTITWQNSHRGSWTKDSSFSTTSGGLLNDGLNRSSAATNGYTWNSGLLLRHKFPQKGRTLSANLTFSLNESTGKGSLYGVNHFYAPGKFADTLDQVYTSSGRGSNYGLTTIYTEPLSKHSLLEMDYSFYQNRSRSEKKAFDADLGGKYTVPDPQQTNDFKTVYTYYQESIRFRHQRKNINLTVGAALQQTGLDNHFGLLSLDSNLKRSFATVLPSATLLVDLSRYSHLHFLYNTNTNQPSVTQLQPVRDNSDPLNIKVGNPGLGQEYYHSFRMNYMAADPFRRTNFFASLNYTGIQNCIVNADEVDSSGARITRPVNVNGIFRTSGNLSYGFPWRAIKSSLDISSHLSYDHTASIVNGIRNNGNKVLAGGGGDLNFRYKELLDIRGEVKLDYNDVRYSLQPGQNQHYWTEEYSLDGTLYLPAGIYLASDLDYTHRTGLPAGYNTSPLVWNASLAKQLFSKKGQVRLAIYDILRQNTGFTRNTNQNYIEDVNYRVLGQYLLLSFTYRLGRFAGKTLKGGMPAEKADIRFVH